MIREWCEGCGQLFPVPGLGCTNLCSFGRWASETFTVRQVAEAFWTAIAHERARTERLVAVYTLSAMLSEEIVALASLDATDRADPKRFDEVRAEAMRLVDLIQTEVGK